MKWNLNYYTLLLCYLSSSIRSWRIRKNFVQYSLSTTTLYSTPPYVGPLSTANEMEFGFELEELGLNVMVGKSRVGEGRGLFLGLSDEAEQTYIEKGTILCGYSKGSFEKAAVDDKTVGCYFSDVTTNVIYEKKIMPLYNAISAVSAQLDDLSTAIIGHTLVFNATAANDQLSLLPVVNYDLYYFIPQMPEKLTIVNLGMYANDLAYSSSILNEASYELETAQKNILNIIWRMEFREQALRPTWPVVIFNKDVLLTNKDPMEVGIQYSWSYWKSHREKLLGKSIAGKENAH